MKKQFAAVAAVAVVSAGTLVFVAGRKPQDYSPETREKIDTHKAAVAEANDAIRTNAPEIVIVEKLTSSITAADNAINALAIEGAKTGKVIAKPGNTADASIVAAQVIARNTPANYTVFSAAPVDGSAYVAVTDNPAVLSNATYNVTFGNGETTSFPLTQFKSAERGTDSSINVSNFVTSTAKEMSDPMNSQVPIVVVDRHFNNVAVIEFGNKRANMTNRNATIQKATIKTADGTEHVLMERPGAPKTIKIQSASPLPPGVFLNLTPEP